MIPKGFASLLFVFSILLFQACNNGQPNDAVASTFDMGEVINHRYQNNFFKLAIPLPDSFHIQSHEETNQLLNLGIEIIGENNEGFKKDLVASSVKNAYLLTAFKYELGLETVDFNPSLIVVAENLQLVPGIQTGKQYLEQTQKLLLDTDLDYSFSGDIVEAQIGHAPFANMTGFFQMGGMTITQDYYTRVEKGFALNIIVSYLEEKDKMEFDNIIQSISYGPH